MSDFLLLTLSVLASSYLVEKTIHFRMSYFFMSNVIFVTSSLYLPLGWQLLSGLFSTRLAFCGAFLILSEELKA